MLKLCWSLASELLPCIHGLPGDNSLKTRPIHVMILTFCPYHVTTKNRSAIMAYQPRHIAADLKP
jgi:hypothetical protein